MSKEKNKTSQANSQSSTPEVKASNKAASPSALNRARSAKMLRRITLTAVCVAFAVVLKCFTNLALNIPGLGIKIGIGGIFNFFPAVLCGPIYGGIAVALTDLLGCIIAPDGAYIPWLTVTAFVGGCIVGLVWRFLTRRASNAVRTVLVSLFAVVLLFGIVANISLVHDGVMGGVVAKQSELPYRNEIDEMPLSPLSKLVTGFAKYSKDSASLSLISTPEASDIELPQTVKVDGKDRKLTSVGAGALKNVTGKIIIGKNYTSVSDLAMGESKEVLLVYGTPDSAAEEFAKKMHFAFEDISKLELSLPTVPEIEFTSADSHAVIEQGGWSFGQSDTYRKNLASNINIVVLGSEVAGIIGIILMLINLFLTQHKDEKNDNDKKAGTLGDNAFSFLKIALSVTLSGLIVTTVNTFILKAFIPAWGDREISILLIPRISEELIVRLIQAYIISLLYGALNIGRAGSFFKKLQ